jgi:hypothetical protein
LIEDLMADNKLPPVFFLTLEPGEEENLATAYKGVKARSSSGCVIDQNQGVKDRKTGEPGLLLEVKQLTIKSNKADVFAGYFSGAGVLYTFLLEKKDGVWTILDKQRRVISG